MRLLRNLTGSALQRFNGARLLMIIVLAQVAEDSRPLPETGQSDIFGHYLDLPSAVAGVVLPVIAVPRRWPGSEGKAS